MSNWTINSQTPEALGAEGLACVFRAGAVDEFRFSLPGAADAAPVFAPFSAVTLAKDSTTWFRGVVTGVAREERAEGGRHAYTVSSNLWWLGEIVYEQLWNAVADPDDSEPVFIEQPSSRVVLGQGEEGAPVMARAALEEILDFAIAAGAPLAREVDAALNAPIPWEEARDRTCLEAVWAVLRWFPEMVLRVDHSTNPATVRIGPAGADTAIDPEAPEVESLTLIPRDNLARPAVVLRYHSTHRVNEFAFEKITTDFHPDPLPANWRLRALVTSMNLAGAVLRNNRVTQPLKTRELPGSEHPLEFAGEIDDGQDPRVGFWKRKHPILMSGNVANIRLANGEHEREEEFPNEIEEGAVADWMEDRLGIEAERQRVAVDVTYELDGEETGEHLETVINATNGQTRNYSSLENTEYTEPEPVPAGLAQRLHTALAGPWTEVRLATAHVECPGAIRPGQRLNGMPVQEVAETLDSGRTRVLAGPPEHLGVVDLVTLLRAKRDRELTDAWQRRKTGMTEL